MTTKTDTGLLADLHPWGDRALGAVSKIRSEIPGPIAQTWKDLFMAHWPISVGALRSAVPSGLTIETHDGSAWVTACIMQGVAPEVLGVSLSGTGSYPELNVRTYVQHGGVSGIYFLSIDFPSLAAYWIAKHLAGIAAFEADMTYTAREGLFTFESRRRGAGAPAVFAARCRFSGEPRVAEPGSLDQFLTDRFAQFFVSPEGVVHRLDIQHPPWHIQDAEMEISDRSVLHADGVELEAPPQRFNYMAEMSGTAWFPKDVGSAKDEGAAPPAPSEASPDAARALTECAIEARARANGVAADPEGRYRVRADFYRVYGFHGEPPGYGASELAFLRWEIDRGVLAAEKGSPWWQSVNAGLLCAAEEARLIFERGLDGPGSSPDVDRWLDYLRSPSPASWYCAHNASIARGYLEHMSLARREGRGEQHFLNMVLYRVLYAQRMVDASGKGILGRVEAAVEHVAADPRLPSVKVLVDLPEVYPRHYPLTMADIRDVLEKGHGLFEDAVRLADDDLVLPEATELYETAARVLGLSGLTALLRAGRPVYPL